MGDSFSDRAGSPFPELQRKRMSDQIAGAIQGAIARGEFAVGTRLPGEHELASMFGTSRGTVREALRILESMGLVEIRSGSGTYVVEPPFAGDALSERLRWLVDRRDLVVEMLEVREGLQARAARRYAEVATDAELAELRAIHERIRAAADGGDGDALVEADAQFHFHIGDRCGNSMLSELARYSEEVYRTSNRALVDLRASSAESGIADEHALVVERIVARDAEGAGRAMREHIRSVRRAVAALAPEGVQP